MNSLTLFILPEHLAVCRLEANAAVPSWASNGRFFSITRTIDELSIVCEQANVPVHIQSEPNWRCLKVAGPLDFALTGILASLAVPLAAATISIFAVSTYDTDYLLVQADDLDEAINILRDQGHHVRSLT